MQNKRTIRTLALLLILALALSLLPGAALAEEETANEAKALPSTFTLPESEGDVAWRLTDHNADSRVSVAPKQAIRISWPAEERAATLYLNWHAAPENGYTLVQRDASDAELRRDTIADGILNRCYSLMEGCAAVEVIAGDGTPSGEETERERKKREQQEGFALSEATVYGAGALPTGVQQWAVRTESPDVLLIAAYPSEEFISFGGLLPLLLDRGVDVQVLFMTERTAGLRNASLEALWSLGLTVQPLYAGFIGRGGSDYDMLRSNKEWGRNTAVAKAIEPMIGSMRPDVVISYAAKAGQLDGAYQLTGEAVEIALAQLEKSRENAWTPKKYYALAPRTADGAAGLEGTQPDTTAALVTYGGESGDALAQRLLDDGFVSLRLLRPQAATGCRYTLKTTTAGTDAGADLLENLPNVPPAPTATPEPTPEPTPESTPEPAAEPTAAPAATAAPQAAEPAAHSMPLRRLLTVAVAAIGLLLSAALIIRAALQKGRKGSCGGRLSLLLALLPLLLGLIVAAALYLLLPEPQSPVPMQAPPAPTATLRPTDPPTLTVAPEPTAQPTQEPTPEPTVQPFDGKWAEFFRAETDPEEVVSVDVENGHWEYRSDTLSVIVERKVTDAPMTYFVAHIRMRDVDAFRPAFSNDTYNGGTPKAMPWQICRMRSAVLFLSGDNLIHMEKEKKGVMIRNGWVYYDGTKSDTLALYPDLTMRIYEKGAVNAQQLLEDGVLNSYGFMYNPILIHNGVLNEAANKSDIKGRNPRAGLGMVEAGHFVAIVVDGRQPDYSIGMYLDEFAKAFQAEGCVEAYNLDGGISASMVFMGEQLNTHAGGDISQSKHQRSVPEGMLWGYSELVPSLDDPILNTGNRKPAR